MPDALVLFQSHLARYSQRTQKTYAAIVASCFAFTSAHSSATPATWRRTNVETFLARPRLDGLMRLSAGRNQELAALRSFAKFAIRDLGWTHDPTDGVSFEREPPRSPPVLSIFEVHRLFRAVAETPDPIARARDLALLAVLAQDGLRVHELVGLDVVQVDVVSATLLSVRQKGGRVDDKALNGSTSAALTAWLLVRPQLARPGEPALFVSSRGTRLSVRTVQRFFERLRRRIGTPKRISPHTMRHSWATIALMLGIDLGTVADQLGHADVNTTRDYYAHLVDVRRRAAVRRLEVAIPPELRPTVASPSPLASAELPEAVIVGSQKHLDVQHGLDAAPGRPEEQYGEAA